MDPSFVGISVWLNVGRSAYFIDVEGALAA